MSSHFRLVAPVVALVLTACSSSQPADDAALLARIEQQIVMPPGAGPLSDYNRRYSREGHVQGGDEPDKVVGLLQRFQGLPRDAAWEDGPVDLVMDGGCSVIYLTYDEARDRIEDIRCNGVA